MEDIERAYVISANIEYGVYNSCSGNDFLQSEFKSDVERFIWNNSKLHVEDVDYYDKEYMEFYVFSSNEGDIEDVIKKLNSVDFSIDDEDFGKLYARDCFELVGSLSEEDYMKGVKLD